MRVVVAGFDGMHDEVTDDHRLVALLADRGVRAESRSWSDTSVPWHELDLVVVRSTWDYTRRYREFIRWVTSLRVPVENAADVVVWSSDKHYLRDLDAQGVPTVPTWYVAPGDPWPAVPATHLVVKPVVSAGARDTGRFAPSNRMDAQALVERITAAGTVAMVQPFLPSVDERGETAVVLIDGDVSHVLRKNSVLRSDGVAPLRHPEGSAEAMYDPDLVRAATADDEEIALAARVLAYVRERFATTPVAMRVDMVRGMHGHPVVLEVEAVEPHLYLDEAPDAGDRLADAIVARVGT